MNKKFSERTMACARDWNSAVSNSDAAARAEEAFARAERHREQGDLAESWGEHGMEYATVAMRFSAIDITRDRSGRTVEGDAATRSMITEIWTFARRPSDRWVLSAIQQAA